MADNPFVGTQLDKTKGATPHGSNHAQQKLMQRKVGLTGIHNKKQGDKTAETRYYKVRRENNPAVDVLEV